VFEKYPHIGPLLPAMGYGDEQMCDLQETINATPCDLVLAATPIDLRRVIQVCHPVDRVHYELQITGQPTLSDILAHHFS
jgi:predicted GTPase